MPIWLTIVLALGGSALISSIIGFIVNRNLGRYFEKKDKINKEEEEQKSQTRLKLEQIKQEEEKKQRIDEIKQLIEPVNQQLKKIDKQIEKLSQGELCSLRTNILRNYYDCVDKGYYNDFDYTNIIELYKIYDDLGGNCFVHDIMDRFQDLPAKEEIKKNTIIKKK